MWSRLVEAFLGPCLGAHAVFERAGGDGETEVIADVGDSIGAGGVQIAVGAFGFDDEGGGFGAHDFAIALGVADMDQEFGVAQHIHVSAGDIDELHGTVGPIGIHHAQRFIGSDDVVLDVAGDDAGADFEEAGFPGFAFPAV
ncbi:MAG: hypothetical protein RI897_2981 [Verrucomicrobiota bacterium]